MPAGSAGAPVVDTYEPNDHWEEAYEVDAGPTYESYISHGQDLDWYKLAVGSAQLVTVSLTNLPADYDLVLFTNLYTSTEETNVLGELQDATDVDAAMPEHLWDEGGDPNEDWYQAEREIDQLLARYAPAERLQHPH